MPCQFKTSRIGFVAIAAFIGAVALSRAGENPPQSQPASATADRADATYTVLMEDCKMKRSGRFKKGDSIGSLLTGGGPKDVRIVKKGRLALPTAPKAGAEGDGAPANPGAAEAADRVTVDFYLPAAPPAYTLSNEGDNDSDYENTSTLVAIDANLDGKLTREEDWYANLPVRIGDRMFEITGIAADGGRIELKASNAPLRGLIVGRKAVPFSFKTLDGKAYSLDDFKGKAFLLDIWSVT